MLNYISPESLQVSLERDAISNLLALAERLTSRKGRGPARSAPEWLTNAAADGDCAAQTQLADIFLQAKPDETGFAAAKPLLEQAAENGYGTAQFRLGFLYLFGLGNPSDYVKAEYYLRAASANGDKDAQLCLSLLLASGTGSDQPLDEAQHLLVSTGYLDDEATQKLEQMVAFGIAPALASFGLASLTLVTRAASCLPDDASSEDFLESLATHEEAGDGNAMLLHSAYAHSEGQTAEAWRHCRNAANSNQPLACLIMAFQAFANQGGESESCQRDQWLDSAVAADLTLAKLFLALVHIQGDRKDANIEVGRKLLVETSTQIKLLDKRHINFYVDTAKPEYLPALALLLTSIIKILASHLLSNGWVNDDINLDEEVATENLRLASKGDVVAQFVCALNFRNSPNANADLVQTAHWLQKAAERGHREAQYLLAGAYGDGQGVDKDTDEEIHWLRLAAQQGHIEAASHLSLVLSGDDRSESELCEAVRWLKVSAESGDPIDQTRLANAYADGRGVEQDDDKALFWWKQAAEQGDAYGQTFAGMHLVKDASNADNFQEGLFWLKKSAEQGDVHGQTFTGMHLVGDVSNPDSFQEGLFWLEKAAEQRDAIAQHRLGISLLEEINNLEVPETKADAMARKKDIETAFQWIQKSADQDYEPAKRVLDELRNGTN